MNTEALHPAKAFQARKAGAPLRIGVYVCHCGINIATRVRVAEVAAFAAGLRHVAVARDYKFMCSEPGQKMIEEDILTLGLTRVVVASCSPRLHEKTFQEVCRRTGINPYHFQMASIREQVSWVTHDPDQATRKAQTLVAAAVHRVGSHEPLFARRVGVHPDVMVVGGGIAGMQAALDIAEAGRRVFLVERSTTLGGHMLQFDKTFPTLDCAACIGTPKMVQTAQHPHIEILAYSDVTDVAGFIGNYTVTVREKPRYIRADACTGCGECAKACPVEMPGEWDQGLSSRKAVYRAFPQAVPITYCIDKYDRAPCSMACPACTNVQGYVQLLKSGRFEQALSLIMETIPLPGVLGRVCPHPCEAACRRAKVDEAVAIRELKRFAADRVDWESIPLPRIQERPEKVAVIGSGPAGLTAAHDLRLLGYRVELFEALPVLGGMLRVGIPDYRLPPEIVAREIGRILRLGVAAHTGCRLGRDMTLRSLETDGFAAIFLGIGAHEGLRLGIPGEQGTRGVWDAVAFLRRANLGKAPPVGRQVLVVGGGNVAMDAARTARRLGAASVAVVYRRTRAEMPAYGEEVEAALAEGIIIRPLTIPTAMVAEQGRVAALECLRTEPGPADEKGRRRPVPMAGSGFRIPCDMVIAAIGQRVAVEAEAERLLSPRQTLAVDPVTLRTAIPGVFAGGDAVSGPATVVEAVAAGRRAAKGMHAFLQNEALPSPLPASPAEHWRPIPARTPRAARAQPRPGPAALPAGGFQETHPTLDEAPALAEAGRCLNCGGCCECLACVSACEARAIDHAMQPKERRIPVGSIILATGFDLMDPTRLGEYGYGVYPNVFTSLEFERLSNATGPTAGRILVRDGEGRFSRPPASVALVHCVGSRDVRFHEYCSRVCCMAALKYSHLIKEKAGHGTAVYDFYIDLRCFGKGYEAFFRRCQEEGTEFIRGRVARIDGGEAAAGEAGQLIVTAEDTLLGQTVRLPVDMVVLCAAMEARADAAAVGRLFGANLGADGFFLEQHPKLAPLDTATDGIFLAGACQGPKDIPDTVAQASGAAAKALALAVKGEVEISPTVSFIDPDLCAGCQVCIGLCPYGAIEFNPRRRIAVVNEALCKGCGSCTGYCPSSAAQVRHFRQKQVFAEIDGLMDAVQGVGI